MTDQDDATGDDGSAVRRDRTVAQRRDDLVSDIRVGLDRDECGRWVIAQTDADAIDVDGDVPPFTRRVHVRVPISLFREIPVEVAVRRPVQEELHGRGVRATMPADPGRHRVRRRIAGRERHLDGERVTFRRPEVPSVSGGRGGGQDARAPRAQEHEEPHGQAGWWTSLARSHR